MIKHSISGQTTISCDPLVLAENIIAGRRITRGDHPEQLLKADLPSLCKGADRIRRALCGDRFEFCTIINARSGRCGEDCRFCAQSCRHHTNAEEYPFLSSGEIAEDALRSKAAGVDRYSIVTAGRGLHGMDFAEAVAVYRRIKRETGLSLCASHGLQTDEEFKQLKAAGVTRYHANIETSARYFPQICTTHTYQNKIDNIQRAHQAGLSICSGGIIGMGETAEDRLDMAISLSELAVDSIPINLFTPIKGTPLADLPPIAEEDVLRTVAFFRYINPTAQIRMAAGRRHFSDHGAALFRSGANAAITGDMLTTTGTGIAEDRSMVTQIGYTL